MDQKRAILAIALSGIVLFSWQAYFAPQVPPPSPQNNIAPSESGLSTGRGEMGKPSELKEEKKLKESLTSPQIPLKTIILENAQGHLIALRSDLSVQDMKNPNESNPFDEIAGSSPLKIQVLEGNRPIDLVFEMNQLLDKKSFRGVHRQTGISLQGYLDDLGRLQFSLTSSRPYSYRLLYNTKPSDLGNGRIRQYLVHNRQDVERFEVGSEENSDGVIHFSAIDHNYHLFALAFKTPHVGRYRSLSNGEMEIKFTHPIQNFSAFLVYSKKNYDHLKELGEKLELSVDFGFFGILAIPILRSLQFFYHYFPNYGLCIILLTLVIRLITFPLQFKSFKSMKKMQVIQPELKKIKEKYSDDPPRMQKETMALFRKAGANPLGGCFPMLLQMPIFFAFYQVLYNAVELVQAPFYFWIGDLSLKDPYYILPVLMGAAMFGQTKLNPSAGVDPTQQKIMLFMPLIFAFIMKDLPSGLNLYILVSTLFGIIQQFIVYKAID